MRKKEEKETGKENGRRKKQLIFTASPENCVIV